MQNIQTIPSVIKFGLLFFACKYFGQSIQTSRFSINSRFYFKLNTLFVTGSQTPGVVLSEKYPTMSTRFSTYRGVILGLFHIHVIGVSKQSRFWQVLKGSILTCSIKECWNASRVVTYLLYCWAICDCKVTSLSTSEWNWRLQWRKNWQKNS